MTEVDQSPIYLSWRIGGIPGARIINLDRLVIGRQEDCDVVLNHPSVSRKHAVIVKEDETYYLTDLNSSIGTLLNGDLLKPDEKAALSIGDKIKISKIELLFGPPGEEISGQETLNMELNFTQSKVFEHLDRFDAKINDIWTKHYKDVPPVREELDAEVKTLTDFFTTKLHEYEVLQEITQILVRILDVKDLLNTALKLVSKVLHADRGFIILFDPKHGNLRTMTSRHFERSDGTAFDYDLSFSHTIAKECYDKKEIILIDDALTDERFHSSQSIIASSIRSVICIPLQQGRTLSGVIYLDNLAKPGCFNRHQFDFVMAFSCQTAIALENARLYTQAVTDGLTRLYNRKYVDERIFEEMVRSRRYDRCCSIILLDIDHFKKVNDTHGHDFGDLVLELVANVFRESARSSDVVSRYGGEEFIMLLTETDLEGAMIFAERLRVAVEALEISHGGTTLRVTISSGVAAYRPDLQSNVGAFIKEADQALYRAKNAGRNRVHGPE